MIPSNTAPFPRAGNISSQADDLPQVVVVDDDPQFIHLTCLTLEREGLNIVPFTSGKEATEWLIRNPADLLIVDLNLHDTTGKDILEELNKVGRTLPFIVITGQRDQRTVIDMLRSGARDYLLKDMDFLDLFPTVVKRVLAQIKHEKRALLIDNLAHLTQVVLEKSYDGVMITSVAKGDPVILYVNPACAKLMGCFPEEVIGSKLSNQSHLLVRWLDVFCLLARGQEFSGELTILGPDIMPRTVKCTMTRVQSVLGEDHWSLTFQDVTEERAAREDLRKSEERLRFASRSAGFGFYDLNLITGETYWSSECERIFGIPPNEHLKVDENNLPCGIHPEDYGMVLAASRAAHDPAGPGELLLEHRILKPDGSIRWVRVQGRTVYLEQATERCAVRAGGVVVDIHDRKIAELALSGEHSLNCAIFETIAAFILVLDRKGRIVSCNAAFEKASGYGSKELEGLNFFEVFLPEEEKERVGPTFAQLVEGRELRNERVYTILLRDGQKRVVSWSNSVIAGNDDRVEFVIGTGLDITERRQLEQNLVHNSEREQQRIGRDLHDGIGQELTATKLSAELLLFRMQQKCPTFVPALETVLQRLRETINHVRLLSHNLAPVALHHDGLTLALSELATVTRSLPGLNCDINFPPHFSLADLNISTQLYRIAQEALNNTVKHSGASQVNIRLTDTEDAWELSISDNGRGLQSNQQTIAGLGLHSMAYRAELISATLLISSPPSGGVCVSVRVPKYVVRLTAPTSAISVPALRSPDPQVHFTI